eukprot:GHVS01081575.1.p1 GENE.GHVS01081575.1~~GHVS01081575.1.p1  ORF type:complete len:210 (-),score=34.91 GHVS01081575.1:292-921(-)
MWRVCRVSKMAGESCRCLSNSAKRGLLEDVGNVSRQKDMVTLHKLQYHEALQEMEADSREQVRLCCDGVGETIKRMNKIRVERTQLSSMGYMNSTEQNMEVFGMVVAGFSGCFAAGLHPIFFFGMVGGLAISNRSRRRENKKRGCPAQQRLVRICCSNLLLLLLYICECRVRVEEITSQITQLRADINCQMQQRVSRINAMRVTEATNK